MQSKSSTPVTRLIYDSRIFMMHPSMDDKHDFAALLLTNDPKSLDLIGQALLNWEPQYYDGSRKRRVYETRHYSYFASDSVNVKVLPCPSPADSTQRRPPWASTRARAIVRPLPLPPPVLEERAGSRMALTPDLCCPDGCVGFAVHLHGHAPSSPSSTGGRAGREAPFPPALQC